MSEFDPPIYLIGDRAGQGRWEIGHYRQHLRYQNRLALANPPIIIPDHPLITMGRSKYEKKVWLNDHQSVHDLLRVAANVSGIDLSEVDPDNPRQWQIWLDSHALEHTLLDRGLGVS